VDLLAIKSLSKSFTGQSVPAVDNVSLSVAEGDFSALVGESGSGKTTLLRMVAGLEMPDAGGISIAGTKVFGEGSVVPPEKRGIGFVFQSHALFPHLTVTKNVSFGLRSLATKARRERVAEMLTLAGMTDYSERYPHELSGGQRQRIALARALAPRPPLVLLDEPFSNLDVTLRSRMRDEVRAMLEKASATVLFVTHDVDDALAMADRIAVMKGGQLVQEGTAREIYEAPGSHDVAEFFGTCNVVPANLLVNPNAEGVVDLLRDEEGRVWIRPEFLEVNAVGEGGAGEILMTGKVVRCVYAGAVQKVKVGIGWNAGCRVDAEAPVDVDLATGSMVEVRLIARRKDRSID